MEPSSDDGDDYANTLAFIPSRHLRMRFRLPSFWKVREWWISVARERRLNRQLAYFADFMTGLHPTLLHQLQAWENELPKTLRVVLRHPHPAHIAPVQRTKSYELERGEDLLYSTLLESLLHSYTNWVFSWTVHSLPEGCRKDVWWDELAHWCHVQLQDDNPDPRTQKIAFAPHLPRTYPLRTTFTYGIDVCSMVSWGELVQLGREIGLNPANGFSELVFMDIGPDRWGLWLDSSSQITNAIRQGSIVGNLFTFTNICVARVAVDVKANAT
ncbi:hypothetical protein L211DRAFT_445308 [Terfezia boudieri ATCC MYA-4762]|uniref:Uncharacterized protein n=1 Tax=Terfezia boudieri ATCC MYA-4762 TaxID=1051890 RepID=A0A3N4LEA9_9PEZI|nr:hypothetical protein L211DRAFT_445308 [Terfezia boudieri ATCC MYA-4762]